VEIQAAAEKRAFAASGFNALMELAGLGCAQLHAVQNAALEV
jgi:ribonuclease PH